MDRDVVDFLLAGEAEVEIAELVDREVSRADALEVITSLRRSFDRDRAGAIFETALLRIRATEKFDDPSRMLFDRDGLEQATTRTVARWRATRVAAAHPDAIVDLGCGIGGDAIELTAVSPVIGVDVDRSRLLLARHNVEVAGDGHRFHAVEADSTSLAVRRCDVAFADPARRSGGRRIRGLDSYLPPVGALIERWRDQAASLVVKVAPGISDDEIPSGASVEWVSHHGALREAMLVLGELRLPAERTATVLPTGVSISGPEPADVPITPIDDWLLEPDDAVIRAGLVRALAAEVGASMIDPDIAYLTASQPIEHPMLTTVPVDEVLAFNLKALRRRLSELDVGVVTIKKRGSPLTPEELRPRLRLDGTRTATIVLTRIGDAPVMTIGLDR